MNPRNSVEFPAFETVLVFGHIDAFASEADAFRIQSEPLLDGGVAGQFDFSARAQDSLPW